MMAVSVIVEVSVRVAVMNTALGNRNLIVTDGIAQSMLTINPPGPKPRPVSLQQFVFTDDFEWISADGPNQLMDSFELL